MTESPLAWTAGVARFTLATGKYADYAVALAVAQATERALARSLAHAALTTAEFKAIRWADAEAGTTDSDEASRWLARAAIMGGGVCDRLEWQARERAGTLNHADVLKRALHDIGILEHCRVQVAPTGTQLKHVALLKGERKWRNNDGYALVNDQAAKTKAAEYADAFAALGLTVGMTLYSCGCVNNISVDSRHNPYKNVIRRTTNVACNTLHTECGDYYNTRRAGVKGITCHSCPDAVQPVCPNA